MTTKKKATYQQTIKFPKKTPTWWKLLYLPVKQAKEEAKKQTFPKKRN
ncbi:MAG: hypothetical protein H8D45_20245 [Bacteroidetes bacterium]|nr:hypothetical protein [Bacteroidota bacterium]